MAIGVRPNVKLAQEAGLTIGETGGVVVNEYMQTSDPDIYAVGDCIEIPNRITGRKVHAPYGDLANLEGRVAGENAASENCVTFPERSRRASARSSITRPAPRGSPKRRPRGLGYEDIITVINASPDKPDFMDAKLLVTKLVADRKTGRMLGAQCVGPGNVSKQIAQWAMAIQGRLTVEDLINCRSALRTALFPGHRSFHRHSAHHAEQDEGAHERHFLRRTV